MTGIAGGNSSCCFKKMIPAATTLNSAVRGDAGERLSWQHTRRIVVKNIVTSYMKHRGILPSPQEWGNRSQSRKSAFQARTVNVMGGGRLSQLIKEEGDCVVTVLHKILQHGRGRKIGSVDDASIALSKRDKNGWLQNNKALSLF